MPDYRSREERRKAQENSKNKPKNKRGLWKKIVLAACIFVGLCIVGGGVAVIAIAKNAPKLNPALLKAPAASTFYDMNGKKITTLLDQHNRVKVKIQNVPKLMKEAVVSIEDRRFYQHFGIDPRRIIGAALADLAKGRLAQGASTIDQQVVKRVFLSPKKTFVRKIQGAWLAIQLDRKYTKDQILQMYLNQIYYGHGAYGIGRASEVYFGTKDLSKLNLSQMALLAGLPNLPTADDPILHPKNAARRRNEVLNAMVKTGDITKQQAKKAESKSIKSLLTNKKTNTNSKNKTPYYGAFLDVLYNKLVNQKHIISKDEFFHGGLKIYTTLDTKAQKEIYHLQHSNQLGYPNKYFNSGIALTDTKTGAILAIGGGRNYTSLNSGIDFATVKTDIGSTAKPIADYGPAIEYLKWSTYHPLEDTPYKWPGTNKPLHDWNNKYMGRMTARNALAYSRNIPAARTFYKVGPNKAAQFAAGLGIKVKKPVPGAFSIGSFQPGASPLQMAAAYAAFGDQGVYHKPYAVRKIVFPNGKTINLQQNQTHQGHVAMHDYTAYMTTDMLKSVIKYGTGRRMSFPSSLPVAGKTGSVGLAQSYVNKYNVTYPRPVTDEWFVGYTPKFSMAVWTGYSSVVHNGQPYFVKGGKHPEYIAQQTFQTVITDIANPNTPDWKMPSSVVQVPIEKDTGKLASQYTPKSDIVKALFVKGTQPTKVSTKYQKPATPQNLQASYDKKKQTINITWSYPKGTKGTQFKVSYSQDGQSMQVLGTTSKKKGIIPHAKPGSTYVIQVTALNGSNQSDPAKTSIKIPGAQLQPPTGAQAKYDPKNNLIALTWNAPPNQNANYEITYSVNGGSPQTLGTTSQTQAVINNAQPGSSYTFQIVAVQGNQKSAPATASVTVPQGQQQGPPGQNPPGTSPTNGNSGKGKGNGKNNGGPTKKPSGSGSTGTGGNSNSSSNSGNVLSNIFGQ